MIFLCDFETTGLVKDGVTDYLAQPGIVQVGALVLAGADGDIVQDRMKAEPHHKDWYEPFEEISAFVSMVNPEQNNWEAGAMKVHGIQPEHVAQSPTYFAIHDRLAMMAEGCDTWSGYHTEFDKKVLWFQLLRYGFERSFPWPRLDLDVMKLATEHMSMEGKRGVKRPKLIEIYEKLFGESFAGQHDALEDIRATARVLRELSK